MATSLNFRLNDELQKKLEDTVKEVKQRTPLGAEVSNSTVVRGALEDFFKRIEEEKQGIVKLDFNVSKYSEEELTKLKKILKQLIEQFDIENIEKNSVESDVVLLLMRIQLMAYKEDMKFM